MKPSDVIPFNFEGQAVRVVTRGGEPWWVLSDVCDVLEIAKADRAASRLDSDEKDAHTMSTLGGPQKLTIINESGLWSLVLTSRKAEAKRFKKWLTSEVIPAIRKDGGYIATGQDETPEMLALRALQVLTATVERQKAQIADMSRDVLALGRIAKADGSLCLTEAAKTLGMPPKSFFGYLQQNNWIYRRAGSRNWLGYAYRCNVGDLEHKVSTIYRPDGAEEIREQVRITPQGLAKVGASLSKAGVA